MEVKASAMAVINLQDTNGSNLCIVYLKLTQFHVNYSVINLEYK